MLVTDHNSYDGYRAWKNQVKDGTAQDFVVLKGIEYDTINAGHMIVVMPEKVKPRILEVRGMPVSLLITIVHVYGGIVGPAHPCGEKYMSFGRTKVFRRQKDSLMRRFDFVETFNADKITCESDLIAAVRRKAPIRAGGEYYHGTTKEKIGAANNVLVYSFWLYNKTSGLLRAHKRHAKVKYLDIGQPRTHDAGG